jgi:BspA type Leucine rich repeat region (6 copies)
MPPSNLPSIPVFPAVGILALKRLAILCCLVNAVSAAQFGDFTYTDNGASITITDFPTTAVGAVAIPATILGKPVTGVGTYAFDRCRELTSVTIPSSVTSIGDHAFIYCDKITSLEVDAANPNYSSAGGVLFNKPQTLLIQYPAGVSGNYTVPAGVTGIGSWAFTESAGLTGVAIPPGVASIGSFAFASCPGLAGVTLASGVSNIGAGAFYNCKVLTSITIPSSVGMLEDSVFSGCIGLTSVTIPSSVTQIGGFAFAHCSGLTGVNIPSSVTRIGSNAFSSCGLTSLTIPPSVTSIEDGAFSGCHGLMVVTIPANVINLGAGAFNPCAGLTAITVDPANPNYRSENGVLFNKPRTTLIQFPAARSGVYTIPSGVVGIADQAFENCAGVTGVTFPTGLTTFGQSAFHNCYGLTSVTIPSSATSVGSAAFLSCSGLTGITIPQGVATIKSSAFGKCSGLRSVVIPASVTSIEAGAFSNCDLLASASFVGNAPSMGSGVFSKAAAGFTIYCINGTTGFTTPTWLGYPVIRLGTSAPVTTWLVSNGFPPDASLKADINGDGVNLLLAYALNLDPNQNLSGSMPQPVFAANQMKLKFYAGRPGITYSVKTSTDLNIWSTTGVTLSGLDANQFRTASVNMSGPRKYMRLVASESGN